MKILEETFMVPYGLNKFGDALEKLEDTSSREVFQYRSTLSVLVEDETYTVQTIHSIEEAKRLDAAAAVRLRGYMARHHHGLITAKLESILFPDA